MPSVLKDESWPQPDTTTSRENARSYRQRIRKKSSRFDVQEQFENDSKPVSSRTSSTEEITQAVDTEGSDISAKEKTENESVRNTEADNGKLLDNPYLSISAKSNTILKNSTLTEDSDAEWKKYRNDEFVKHLNQNNFRLKPPFEVSHQEYPPDTFAKKPKNRTKSIESGSSYPPSGISPPHLQPYLMKFLWYMCAFMCACACIYVRDESKQKKRLWQVYQLMLGGC